VPPTCPTQRSTAVTNGHRPNVLTCATDGQ
jgi:hypothetical protein